MAGAIIEVKYFNTFILKKTSTAGDITDGMPVWNGSFGVPNSVAGSYPVITNFSNENAWALEESRIRGGFNNTSVDFGAKAYLVEEEPNGTRRFNSLIYSGIFNSRTGINNTNVFSIGEDITKSADPANGSIQKLYAEDTNLNLFQELKVSRALIDKDAIFAAEGGGTVTASNLVIGVIQPYTGKYGIAKNPESFAVYGKIKYFSDANNNVMLKLSTNGIEEISAYGMVDFFRDRLQRINSTGGFGKILGGYDIYSNEYVVSVQPKNFKPDTVNFDEKAKGWISRFSYIPDQLLSIRNNFYTVSGSSLYQHYSNNVPRAQFYGIQRNSSITFIFNPNPTNSKTFSTIGYEGSNGWKVLQFSSDKTGRVLNNLDTWVDDLDTGVPNGGILSQGEGEYVLTEAQSTVFADSNSNTFTLNLPLGLENIINAGDIISGPQQPSGSIPSIAPGTTVVSFDSGSGVVVTSQTVNVKAGQAVFFNGSVSRADYINVLGTSNPNLPRYYAGFVLKENKYVANLNNNSIANTGEIIFGQSISGIKGFYSTVTMVTDITTDYGGPKTLFSVESNYSMNNGY
tara:strand:- start:233 stop:1945 length:1713 start_codon:yes stop_codon:yes gene_type:complete